jgi:hypothetical protein
MMPSSLTSITEFERIEHLADAALALLARRNPVFYGLFALAAPGVS